MKDQKEKPIERRTARKRPYVRPSVASEPVTERNALGPGSCGGSSTDQEMCGLL
jgi:hypothetical protein